jgi:hypothetical protein
MRYVEAKPVTLLNGKKAIQMSIGNKNIFISLKELKQLRAELKEAKRLYRAIFGKWE